MRKSFSRFAEALEERQFLSTASTGGGVAGAVAAPHAATAAQHATPTANAARVNSASAQGEAADGEDSAQAAPAPAPATPVTASENEDQTSAVAQSNDTVAGSNSNSVEPTIEAALPQLPVRSPGISNAGFETKAILENATIAGDAELSRASSDAPRADVTAVVFNTRYLVTPHDGEARAAAFPLATLAAPQALAASFSARAPVILKSTTDALLGLGRPDVLGTFADAITSFAHESAAAAAAAVGTILASPETHYYKWEVTGTVLGIDALLIGHWYATRRRRTAAAGAMPPFSTRAIREVEGGRDPRIC